jgi:hypothetical protein
MQLAAFPGRRIVRSLELASLIDLYLSSALDHPARLLGEPPASGRERPPTSRRRRTPAPGYDLRPALTALRDTLSGQPGVGFAVARSRSPRESGRSAEPVAGDRVLIASTPRAGNTLVQRLLVHSFGHEVVAAHGLSDVDLDKVAGRIVFQLHLGRSDRAVAFATMARARVITIARHPLDVLLSILHFSQHEPQVLYWLDGQAFDRPGRLVGASPTSPAFLDWATGDGAAGLLAVTSSWWSDPAVLRLRYEDLVGDTDETMAALAADIGLGGEAPKANAKRIQELVLRGLPNHHRWRGKPGGWRDLLPADVATTIRDAHRATFDALGYDVTVDTVDQATADLNWLALKR